MAKSLTKEFIKKQKEKLLKEKESVASQIEMLSKDDPFRDPDHASDNAAVDTDVREQVGHDTIEAEVKDLTKKMKDMNHALAKIDKNTYGTCERCGMEIPKPRLELIPEARFCIACERDLHK